MRAAILTLALLSCSSRHDAGTAECAAFDEPCPSECSGAREVAFHRAASCWQPTQVACARTQPAGHTAMVGCCVRSDGLVFRPAMGGPGCVYREPAFVGFRDCTPADTEKLASITCAGS